MATKYEKLANIIKESIPSLIRQGQLKLPTEASYCNKYNLSRETVRKAIELLVSEGIIYSIQGSGTFIRPYNLNSNRRDVAIILSSSTEYIYPALITDISNKLSQKDYNPYIYINDGDISTERNILLSLDTDNLAGIIAEPVKTFLPTPNIDVYERFNSLNIPVIFIKSSYSNLDNFIYIRSDDNYGGYLAAKHLIGKGHQRIALFFNRDTQEGLERVSGALAAITDSSLAVEESHDYWYYDEQLARLRYSEDISFINTFIDTKMTDTTACICQSDEIAYFLIRELNNRKISVPNDYSIISFDNSYLSDFGKTPITSLANDDNTIAAIACDTLFRLINGESASSHKLSWHIVTRQSDG